MPTFRFLQYGPSAESAPGPFSTTTGIHEAARKIQRTSSPRNILVGSVVQEPGAIQVISQEANELGIDSISLQSWDTVQSLPRSDFRVAFEDSLFGTGGPATGRVVEYVQHFFPASHTTPEFRREIERDFVSFIQGFSKGGIQGRLAWTFGWTLEDLDHPEVVNAKAKSFVIVVGWESMEDFERSIEREAFKSALRILLAWKAPYKMVSCDVHSTTTKAATDPQ